MGFKGMATSMKIKDKLNVGWRASWKVSKIGLEILNESLVEISLGGQIGTDLGVRSKIRCND